MLCMDFDPPVGPLWWRRVKQQLLPRTSVHRVFQEPMEKILRQILFLDSAYDEVKVMSLDLNYDALKDLGAHLKVGVREGFSDLYLSNRTRGAFNLADSVWVGFPVFWRGGGFRHCYQCIKFRCSENFILGYDCC